MIVVHYERAWRAWWVTSADDLAYKLACQLPGIPPGTLLCGNKLSGAMVWAHRRAAVSGGPIRIIGLAEWAAPNQPARL